MRRIYFLLPSVDAARLMVEDLLLARVDQHRIHVVAREDTPLEDLPAAGIAQTSDLVPALQRGAAAGGIAGALAGLVAVTFPSAGLVLGGGALLGLTLFGAGFGAWMSSMVGIGLPSSRIAQYEQAITAGQLLMMIDVQPEHVDEVEALVLRHHPEAVLEGVDRHIPLFP